MGIALKCLEHVTAFGCVLAAYSVGSLDPGLTALGVVSGAAIIARFKEHCTKHGLDEPELLKNMQLAVLRQWDTVDQTQADRDAIAEADSAMRTHLLDCMLTREDLAASSVSKEHYPKRAARLVTDRLAKKDTIFAAPSDPMGNASLQRRFAEAVIELSLKTAMDDPAYSLRLMLDLIIAGNSAHALTHCELQILQSKVDTLIEATLPRASAMTITETAMLELARRVTSWVDDPSQALAMLDSAISELVAFRAVASRGTNFGSLIDDAVRRTAACNELGRFDEGGKVLADEYSRLQGNEIELRGSKLTIADRAIDQARLQSHPKKAAYWVMEKLLTENIDGVSQDILLKEQDRWFSNGASLGLAFDLEVSVLLARKAIERSTTLLERAQAEHDLAICLRIQGERTKGDKGWQLLKKAVAVCRLALKSRTEAGIPVELAKTQNNLANALTRLGERTSGDAGLTMLDEALTNFNSALSVFTETETPSNWAAVQNNLANTLQIRGELTAGKEGVALLARAITANRAALRVRTKIDMPNQWAATQCNLGNALTTLGRSVAEERGLELLTEAVAVYREALTIYTETIQRSNWAMTQKKLADALRAQSELIEGQASLLILKEAANAYRAALSVWTSEYFSHYCESAIRDLALIETSIAARLLG
jgi:tetratricopeptide (TPR) repeat protein